MKRHAALVALSRDHHEILTVARLLRRRGETVTGGRRLSEEQQCRVVRQFLDGLCAHFRVEEGALQVAAGSGGSRVSGLVQATVAAHRRLERNVSGLRCATATGTELVELGARLHDYVRHQERDVFEQLQATLGEPVLAVVAAYLAREHRPETCRAPLVST